MSCNTHLNIISVPNKKKIHIILLLTFKFLYVDTYIIIFLSYF